ncbi:unnamed protein product [Tenebrio molitor]|nr:unnamed protein product [Tenebrio molitor]
MKQLTHNYHVNMIKEIKTQRTLPEHQLFIIDLTCHDSLPLLKQAEKLGIFKSPFRWILYGPVSTVSSFYFAVDSQVFIIEPDRVETIYKYSPKSSFVRDDVTSLSKRTNLMGATIKISIVITNPDSLNHLWDYRNKHMDAISKLNYILVHQLMSYLNASKEIIIQKTWGYKNQTTGLYSGMAGDLQTGVANLGGTPLFFTTDRIDIIDYIAATTPTYMKFIFKAPPLTYVTNVFTLPFAASVWHYCFVMVAVVVIFVYLVVLWEWKEVKFRKTISGKRGDTLRPNIFDVIMMEIGAITQQGSDVEPQSIAGRIIFIFTLTTLMFLYTSYSANIVALLQSTTDSIKTLDDLLHSRIKLGVEDIVYAHYYFENAVDPTRRAIYEQKVAPKGQKPSFMKAEEGIRRVQEGFFAFHIELNTGYKLISDVFQEGEKCGLKEIEYVNLIEPWLATEKKSPYKEVMKIGMRKIHETGIQNREIRRVYTRKPQCHTRGSNFGSVGLIDCYSAFLIFGIGIGLGVLLFVLELIAKEYFLKKNHTEN